MWIDDIMQPFYVFFHFLVIPRYLRNLLFGMTTNFRLMISYQIRSSSELNYFTLLTCVPIYLVTVAQIGCSFTFKCICIVADSVCNVQIVKEYERAVIFRLGRITDRKPKGPG